ncbi:MAG: protease complex subunit PrcB family protein [Brumimicrobium sp.]
MNFKKTFILVSALLFGWSISFSSCSNSKSTQKESSEKTEKEMEGIYFESIAKGVMHGAGDEGIDEGHVRVTSASEMHEMLEKMNRVNDQVDESLMPSSDYFEEYIMVFLFDKVRGSGGHSISTKNTYSNGEEIFIDVELKSPTGPATSVMTQPYEVIQLEKSENPISVRITEL